MAELKRTPLYKWHKEHGAKLVPFGGYEMPLYYSSIIKEHKAVRTSVGMFDVSHMGEVIVKGNGALDFVNYLLPAKLKDIPEGKVKYSFLLRENGGIVDDLLVYPFSQNKVMLVINASNIGKDMNYISAYLPEELSLKLMDYGNIAVQGPHSLDVLSPFFDINLKAIKFYFFRKNVKFARKWDVILSRTGYTGDLGFEIYAREEDIPYIWEIIFKKGITPCGLGARDTLRLEAGYPLYGHELSDEINPIEAGLSSFIFWDKDFVGKDALLKIKKKGIEKKLVGFTMERGVPRQGYKIFKEEKEIGWVTSGALSPMLGKMIGMGYVKDLSIVEGDSILISIRGRRIEAQIVSLPFYKK